MKWDELDLAQRSLDAPQITHKERQGACRTPIRTINGGAQASREKAAVRLLAPRTNLFRISVGPSGGLDQLSGVTAWRLHDLRRTCVSGMARLGIAPHVADKILNHQAGTISGVAAVYQRHEFLSERQHALEIWGDHVERLVRQANHGLKIVA